MFTGQAGNQNGNEMPIRGVEYGAFRQTVGRRICWLPLEQSGIASKRGPFAIPIHVDLYQEEFSKMRRETQT